MKKKLSDPSVENVALEDIDGEDYLYFVNKQTKKVYRLTHETLLAWLEQELEIEAGSASAITSPDTSASVTALDDGQVLTTIDDVPVETVELAQRHLRHVLASGRTVEVSIGDQGAWGVPLSGIVETVSSPGAPPLNLADGPPTDPTYRYGLRVLGDASALGGVSEGVTQLVADSTGSAVQFIGRAGSLINGFSVQSVGEFEATAGVVAQIVEGVGHLVFTGRLQVQTPTTGTPDAGSMMWLDSMGYVRRGDAPVPTAVSEALYDVDAELADHEERLDDAEAEITTVSGVASGALPKPGGTTTPGGIVTGSGAVGAAVAVSTTTIADIEPRAGVQAPHSGATRTLADADRNQQQALTTACELRIPTSLSPGLSWTGRMTAANPVTFAVGGGYIPIEFLGKNTATAAGTRIFVFVESATLATVTIVEKVP